MTEEEIEAGAHGIYGKHWNSSDPERRPGDKMKDVWRRMAKDCIEAVDIFRAEQLNERVNAWDKG